MTAAPTTVATHPVVPVAGLVVGSALVVDPWGWAPFGPLKWTVISTVALLAVAATLRHRVTAHRRSLLGWGLFLGWGVVAGIVAVDPLHTWIGTPDRHLGWLTWLLLGALFVVGQNLGDVRPLARSVTVALAGTGAYTLAELAGFHPLSIATGAGRLVGPYGNPAYLGAGLVLMVPIASVVAADATEPRGWRVTGGLAAMGGGVALIGSQTRAAWIGPVAAAVVGSPVWWPMLRRRRWAIVVAVAAGVALVTASPVGHRIASAVDFEDGGGAARLAEWTVGVRALGAHAITGTGFEGYRVVFPEHVDVGYARTYGREVAPDRAHNAFLDVGITAGFPGAMLGLAAAGWLVMRAWRTRRSGSLILIGCGSAVAGYLVQQQFLFPIAEIDPVFWVVAGAVVAATARSEATIEFGPWRPGSRVLVGAAVVALIAGFLDVTADHAAAEALDNAAAGDPVVAAADAAVATRLRPDSIRYLVISAEVGRIAGDPASLHQALDDIETALDRSPGDPILLLRKGEILLELAGATGEPGRVAAAIAWLTDRSAVDPTDARNHLGLGIALAMDGESDAATRAMLTAADLAPRSAVPGINLALLYLGDGQIENATTALEQARSADPTHPQIDEVAALIEQNE